MFFTTKDGVTFEVKENVEVDAWPPWNVFKGWGDKTVATVKLDSSNAVTVVGDKTLTIGGRTIDTIAQDSGFGDALGSIKAKFDKDKNANPTVTTRVELGKIVIAPPKVPTSGATPPPVDTAPAANAGATAAPISGADSATLPAADKVHTDKVVAGSAVDKLLHMLPLLLVLLVLVLPSSWYPC